MVLAHPISMSEWRGTVKYPTFGVHILPSQIGIFRHSGGVAITFYVCHHLVCTTLFTSSNGCSPHLAFQTSKRHRLVIRQVSTVPSRCRPENRKKVRAWPISVHDGISCATLIKYVLTI